MAITYDVTTGIRALDGANLISDIDTGVLSLAQDIVNQRHALQAGVIDSGSYMAVQKAAGANMSVDVGSNSGRGMYVSDASSRLVFVAPTGSVTNVAVTTAHATLPRIDAVVVSSAGVVSVVAGTATSGATLDNARDGSHGGAAVPSGSQLVADILVGAAVSTIPNTVIRDRRPWARGAYVQTVRSSADYTITSSSLTAIDATNLSPRIECSGVPLRVSLNGYWTPAATNQFTTFALYQDGSTLSLNRSLSSQTYSTAPGLPVAIEWVIAPAAGSHVLTPRWASNGTDLATLRAGASTPLIFVVQEITRQNTANNSTTSG